MQAPLDSPNRFPSSSWGLRAAWLLAGLLAMLLLETWTSPTDKHDGRGDDGRIYVAMAEAQRSADLQRSTRALVEAGMQQSEFSEQEWTWALAHQAPFCWRVLSPSLAAALPLDAAGALTWSNRLAQVLGWILLGYLLGACGASHGGRAFAGALWLGSLSCLRLSMRLPCYIDPMTQALWLAGLLMVATGRDRRLPLFLAVAVLQKESLALLLPIAAVARWQRSGWQPRSQLPWLALGILLPALVLTTLRSWITPLNAYEPLAYFLRVVQRQVIEYEASPKLLAGMLAGGGLATLLPLVAPLHFGRWARRFPWLACSLVVALAAYLGGHDKTRLLAPAMPALVLFAAWLWPSLSRSHRGLTATLAASTLWVHLQLGAQWSVWTGQHPAPWRILPGRIPLQAVWRNLEAQAPWVLLWLLVVAVAAGGGRRQAGSAPRP